MKKISLSIAVLLGAAGLSFAQSPALTKFFNHLENMDDRMSKAIIADDKAAIEELYTEIASLYEQQPREVKDAAAPLIGGVWYNIACMRSLQKNTEGAMEALTKAIDYGWHDYSQTINDPALNSIRNNAEFKELVAKIR